MTMTPLFDMPLDVPHAAPVVTVLDPLQEAVAAALASEDAVQVMAALDAEQHLAAGDADRAAEAMEAVRGRSVVKSTARQLTRAEREWEDHLTTCVLEAQRVRSLDRADAAEPLARMVPQYRTALREVATSLLAVLAASDGEVPAG